MSYHSSGPDARQEQKRKKTHDEVLSHALELVAHPVVVALLSPFPHQEFEGLLQDVERSDCVGVRKLRRVTDREPRGLICGMDKRGMANPALLRASWSKTSELTLVRRRYGFSSLVLRPTMVYWSQSITFCRERKRRGQLRS